MCPGSYTLKLEMSVRGKDTEGCLEGGGKEIRMVVEEGIGKGDEDGGGHGGAGRSWGRSWGRR